MSYNICSCSDFTEVDVNKAMFDVKTTHGILWVQMLPELSLPWCALTPEIARPTSVS